MKKILSLFLAFACVFSLASCSLFGGECENHKDVNSDMYCDECGIIFVCPDHADADANGACDTCGAAFVCSAHADANKDGKCDKCKTSYQCPGHRDTAADGQCDVCKAMFTCEHLDENSDGVCDKCRANFNCASHQDLNADGFCDFCEGQYICTDHKDADGNAMCDMCGQSYYCPGHIDADDNGRCDECAAFMGAAAQINPKTVAAFVRAYSNSLPTKITSETVRTVGSGADSYVLTSKSTLLTGSIAGKNAAIYEESYQELRDIESGSEDIVTSVFKTTTIKKEFIAGKGVRTTKDGVKESWSTRELDFSPTKGSIALAISENNINVKGFTVEENKHVMEFTVPNANIGAVFGNNGDTPKIDATSDVSVILTSNGATITSVILSYTVASAKDVPVQSVVVEVNYEYSMQNITIE